MRSMAADNPDGRRRHRDRMRNINDREYGQGHRPSGGRDVPYELSDDEEDINGYGQGSSRGGGGGGSGRGNGASRYRYDY